MSKPVTVVLGLILLFGFWLRFRAADHAYISQWDEAYHALVAKNLVQHPLEPTLYEEAVLPARDLEWTTARVWLHKPPLPLWLMAAGIAAFGENELSFRLASVILDTLVVLLVFFLAEELFGAARRPAGLLAAAFYALNPLMIRLVSGRIPDDTPHVVNAFFITCTILLFAIAARKKSRAYAAAAGLSMGLGTMCMSAVALLGLAASLPVLLSRRGVRGTGRLLALSALAFMATALPWPLYCLSRWPEIWRHESALHVAHLFSALDAHAHSWWWYLKILPVQYGGSALLVWGGAVALAVYTVRAAVRGKEAGLMTALCWVLVPYLFFSVIATKLYAYVCVAVPALCLLAGVGTAALWAARRGRYRVLALAGLFSVGVQTTLVALERVVADYSHAPWNELYDYPSLRRAMLDVRGVPGPKVILNVGDSKAPQAMYYSGASAYADAPEAMLVRDLLARGYRVFVLLDEKRTGADEVRALRQTGLSAKIIFLTLPAPPDQDVKHPYEA